MNRVDKAFAAVVVLAIILICLTLMLTNGSNAEITPSEAPMEHTIIGIQRVDLDLYADPVRVKIEIPVLETDEYAVLITDGYHIVQAYSVTTGNGELFCLFHTRDLRKMDGTVGLYLIWLAKTEQTEN